MKGNEQIIRRFDIVAGSGSKGQTYITRFENSFINYRYLILRQQTIGRTVRYIPLIPVLFNRPITSRCLECHSTFAHGISAPNHGPRISTPKSFMEWIVKNVMDPPPGMLHFKRKTQKKQPGKFILNPATFSRKQNLDLCGLCHGGRLQNTKPSFGFVAGDNLSDYFKMDTSAPDPDNIDVHGNQLGLLRVK